MYELAINFGLSDGINGIMYQLNKPNKIKWNNKLEQ